jgi:hypothetical protein
MNKIQEEQGLFDSQILEKAAELQKKREAELDLKRQETMAMATVLS